MFETTIQIHSGRWKTQNDRLSTWICDRAMIGKSHQIYYGNPWEQLRPIEITFKEIINHTADASETLHQRLSHHF